VSIFTKRNALVGFLTLKALERRRKQRKRHTWKLAAFVALGIVSAGIFAAVALAVVRRHKDGREPEDAQRLEGYAVADEPEIREASELDVGVPEPGFAA
jgi:hypothetical protein